ncbi:MAG: YbaK/EbsC family protein, partial [Deferrisomatales bacterium]
CRLVPDQDPERIAERVEAEKLTGYQVGGISPFGTRKALPVWFHAPLRAFATIGVNGGRRGLIVFLRPADLVLALGARAEDLSA